MESDLSGIFQVKVVAQTYTVWVPTPRCFYNVMSLFEEIKFYYRV